MARRIEYLIGYHDNHISCFCNRNYYWFSSDTPPDNWNFLNAIRLDNSYITELVGTLDFYRCENRLKFLLPGDTTTTDMYSVQTWTALVEAIWLDTILAGTNSPTAVFQFLNDLRDYIDCDDCDKRIAKRFGTTAANMNAQGIKYRLKACLEGVPLEDILA